jgi:hypothetical protein
MEQSSFWQANSRLDSQDTPHLLQQKAHYLIHKIPPLDSSPSQMNQDYIRTSYIFKINFNIILPSTSRFPKWNLPFRFTD